MAKLVGWDIGGVHTKAAWVPDGDLDAVRTAFRSYEIWRQRDTLVAVLREVLTALAAGVPDAMAVTMTAELSDTFCSKREGVLFVLDALTEAFPCLPVYLLGLERDLVPLSEARRNPLSFAAANWLASALFVAEWHPSCILLDIGSTTTDIVPILQGRIVAEGNTDTGRLAAGELVYTGVIRTNPNTIVSQVPLRGRMCRVAAEYFSVMGDIYLMLGVLSPRAYSGPTPDGRGKTLQDAQGRLARLVCADQEVLTPDEIHNLARYLHQKQLQQVEEALLQVLSRLDQGRRLPVVAAGLGRFLVEEIGRRFEIPVIDLVKEGAAPAMEFLPCVAAAWLLESHLRAVQPL
jgi:hypothetical protein